MTDDKYKKLEGRKIYCAKCHKLLGKIRHGSMVKTETIYVCEKCWEEKEEKDKLKKEGEQLFNQLFRGAL